MLAPISGASPLARTIRFRSSDKSSGGAVSGGEIKPGSRAPRLDPLHIQALSAPVSKKSAKNRNQDGEVVDEADKKAKASPETTAAALAAAVAAIKQRTANGGGRKAVPLSPEELVAAAASSKKVKGGGVAKDESKGSGEGGGKKANKREAAEMLGPDTTDQLAAATAKVRVSDVVEEDGEAKRVNKREAAEMLGPDAADQLAAATAKVRVSDDNEYGEDSRTKGDGTCVSTTSGEKPGSAQHDETKESEREEQENGKDGEDTSGAEPATLGENGKHGEATDGEGPSPRKEPGFKKVKGVKASGEDGKITVEKRAGKTGVSSVTGESEETEGCQREDKVNGKSSRGDERKALTLPSDASDAENKSGGQDTKVREELEEETGDVKVEKSQATEDNDDVNNDNGNDNGDGVSFVSEEEIDVGAWSMAAPASRSPILMIRNVNSEEVTPGALCQLFGLYGDVMKVGGCNHVDFFYPSRNGFVFCLGFKM